MDRYLKKPQKNTEDAKIVSLGDVQKKKIRLLEQNRLRVQKHRMKHGISSTSSRLYTKIPKPGFSVNKYSTPIFLSFD